MERRQEVEVEVKGVEAEVKELLEDENKDKDRIIKKANKERNCI